MRNYYAALGFKFMSGFGMVTQLSTGNSLLQLNVPDELRARLMSLFGLIVMGFAPMGMMIYGVIAHFIGPGPTIIGGSLLAAVAPAPCCWVIPTCATSILPIWSHRRGSRSRNQGRPTFRLSEDSAKLFAECKVYQRKRWFWNLPHETPFFIQVISVSIEFSKKFLFWQVPCYF